MPELDIPRRNYHIAMLIDGDNAQPSLLGKFIIEASRYGTVIIRRIYGDWTNTSLNSWKKLLPNYAIQPVQQFQNTVGKNATDSALIIDAMDLLHQGVVDCFCLVSSDSDFTRLATRIRESGSFVIGIGKTTTPQPFVAACDVFIETENLGAETDAGEPTNSTKTQKEHKPIKSAAKPDLLPLLKQAFEISVQENGLALLSALGIALRKIQPGFDTRSYGHKQLSALLSAYPKVFKLDENSVNVRLVGSSDK